ncbi:MAG: Gmad2 immunoglobulin-like domain-containing protein [bacterium]|nr:Gmad2 immunoglobulin-like domain-containing protein [bacterium]
MKKTHIIILLVLILVIAGILMSIYQKQAQAPVDVTPIPTPVTTIPNDLVISYSGENAKDMIKVTYPRPGDTISSPLIITGEARGTWYFEASFPVTLTDGDGLIIAEGHAEAQGEWMTENFVPFKATLTFTKPANASAFGNRSFLILHNDNPSGDYTRNKSAEIPVFFK